MSNIVTYKGKLPIGVEEKIHLSTNDGLTGYRINKFQIMSGDPAVANEELIGKIRLTEDANIGPSVDFSDTDLLAVVVKLYSGNTNPNHEHIIQDKETFNQDIFVYISSANSSSTPANFYIELEKFKIDLNTSTYHTLKNLRSKTQWVNNII